MSTSASWLARLLSPAGSRGRLAVFCYHQVLESADPLRAGEPTSEQFDDDLETITDYFNVLPLPEAAHLLREGRLPERAAAITFDDGYRNNYTQAMPILERRKLPATFYIATGMIEDGVMWNDLIINAIGACTADKLTHQLENCGHAIDDIALRRQRIPEILGALKYRPLAERLEQAKEFYFSNTGHDELPRLMMNKTEVNHMSKRGFDIGAHTVRHPILATLDDKVARDEIFQSRDWLHDATGQQPVSFAYPNGIPERDFTERDAALVEEAGFDTAVTTQWALATSHSNDFRIPRVGPWWRQGREASAGQLRAYVKSYLS